MSDEQLLSSYDYELPPELIAAAPSPTRDASRLLVLDRSQEELQHKHFSDLPGLLHPGDLLVVNETRVIPARLHGVRSQTGGRWEGLFLGTESNGDWKLIGQTRGRLVPGETITLIPIPRSDKQGVLPRPLRPVELVLQETLAGGVRLFRPTIATDPLEVLDSYGTLPLPPYMHRDVADATDWNRYQTTYARVPGAIAAPTAGLHFTPELFDRCRAKGVDVASVTLHVGLGTFRPVQVENLDDHVMHHEWCDLSQPTIDAIARTKANGGRVIAVGTTTVRTLESVAATGRLRSFQGETNLFIRPPYQFQVVDGLITNFHLPKSTLLVLVSAFAGRERILNAYQAAIAEKYRFYSYGDAMVLT